MKIVQLLETSSTPTSSLKKAIKELFDAQNFLENEGDYHFRDKVTWTELETGKVRIVTGSRYGQRYADGVLLRPRVRSDGGVDLDVEGLNSKETVSFPTKSECRLTLNTIIPFEGLQQIKVKGIVGAKKMDPITKSGVFAIPKEITARKDDDEKISEFVAWLKTTQSFSGKSVSDFAGLIKTNGDTFVIPVEYSFDMSEGKKFKYKIMCKSNCTVYGYEGDDLEDVPISDSDIRFTRCKLKRLTGSSSSVMTFFSSEIESCKDLPTAEKLVFQNCEFGTPDIFDDKIPDTVRVFKVLSCKGAPTSLKGINKKLPSHIRVFAVTGIKEAILGLYDTDLFDVSLSQIVGGASAGALSQDYIRAIKILKRCKDEGKSVVQAQRELIKADLDDYAEL